MEKFPMPYDKESMRMAMLKHEETFKEQVYELHRLYRVQKLLMKNIGSSNGRNQELWSMRNSFSPNKHNNHHCQQNPNGELDLERPADQDCVAESNIGDKRFDQAMIDESEIELTLGPTSYNRRKKPETPVTSDSGPSFSSSSTGSSHINRTSSLTHQKTKSTRQGLRHRRKPGFVQVPDMALGCQNGGQNNTDHVEEEQLRQEKLKQPPWFFQVLSLNMT